MIPKEFGHTKYFVDTNISTATGTTILDTFDNYSKVQKLYNRTVSNDDIFNIFRYNGFFALKYFILKLNDETMVSRLWNHIVTQVENIDILQSQCECNYIGDKARIIIAEHFVDINQLAARDIPSMVQTLEVVGDKTCVDNIYYCRSKQTSFGTKTMKDTNMQSVIHVFKRSRIPNNNNNNDDNIYEKYHLYFFKKN